MIRWLYAGISCLLLLMLVLGALLLHYSFRGFTAHVVLSGSMEPMLPKGSVVVSRADSVLSYRMGDVVVFTLPTSAKQKDEVIHRIVRRVYTTTGIEGVETKGDANTNGDPWVVPLGLIAGRVWFTIPYIGYLFQYEKGVTGYLVVVVITFFAIIIQELFYLRTGMQVLISSFYSKLHTLCVRNR